jgi:hypothetical protein
METAVIITVVVCGTSLIGYIGRLLYASKCSKVDCLGLHIKRDTAIEPSMSSVGKLSIHR